MEPVDEIGAATMAQYRYRCWAMQNPGDQPWRCSLKEAVHDIIEVVKTLMAQGGVAQMVLDEGVGIEQETIKGTERRTWPCMDFYQARDFAIDRGWVENKTGRWLGNKEST